MYKLSLKNISILKKLTLAFLFFILSPALILCIYSYRQTTSYMQSSIIDSSQIVLGQVCNSIQSNIKLVENLNTNICYNNSMQNFLATNYNHVPFPMDDYFKKINPFVQNAINFYEANISRINIFIKNPNIPEGFGTFFSYKDIENKQWLKEINGAHQANQAVWVKSTRTDFSDTYVKGNKVMFFCVQNIVSAEAGYLGIIATDVDPDDLFSPVVQDFESGNYTYYYSNGVLILYPKSLTIYNRGYFFIKRNSRLLSLSKHINSLDIDVKLILSMPQNTKAQNMLYYTMVSFIAILIACMLVFYVILRMIFWKMNRNIRYMNIAITENFSTRIPVNRKDEIGQMASSFNILLDRINALVKDIVNKETAHKNVQLKALQYQINPHFIYNTIDIFAGKLELLGQTDIADSLADFGKMLRYNINSKSMFSTMSLELQYAKSYIAIQKIRCADRLIIDAILPPHLENKPIIRFILQPLVENSIKHGFRNKNQGTLTIQIEFIEAEDHVQIIVKDNGSGIETEKLEALNHQLETSEYTDISEKDGENIGLQNINERLRLFYGPKYHLVLESKFGISTKCIIRIPTKSKQEN